MTAREIPTNEALWRRCLGVAATVLALACLSVPAPAESARASAAAVPVRALQEAIAMGRPDGAIGVVTARSAGIDGGRVCTASELWN
jgi:hypothetical protein